MLNFLTIRPRTLPLLSFLDKSDADLNALGGAETEGPRMSLVSTIDIEESFSSKGVVGADSDFESPCPNSPRVDVRRLLSFRCIRPLSEGGARCMADVDCDKGEGVTVRRRVSRVVTLVWRDLWYGELVNA